MAKAQLPLSRKPLLGLLKESAAEIEAVLDRLMPEQGAQAGTLVRAMRYAALGEAKRLRPFLLTETAELFSVPRNCALRAGAALECIHCYSLVHDDLPAMDNDDLRRGRPTLHKAFDEATAILAGDALHTLAFEILADPSTHPDGVVRSELIAALARASGRSGMAGGQMLDLEAEREGPFEAGEVRHLQSMKTGALFRFACEAGAILGHAQSDERHALRQYAENIGLAFQIADDLLDIHSTSEKLGKKTQKDKAAGKATFVAVLGPEGARIYGGELIEQAKALLFRFGDTGHTLARIADFVIERSK